MPIKVDAFRVFIASPGGLEAERNAVREEITRFNEVFMHESGIAFSSERWEDVPGGMRRPQELINELVECCDYMILILGSRWGTKPAKDSQFTSGTEEEFFLAKKCIDRTESPMTDILVLFKGVPEDQLSDPGEQLRKVIEFKGQLEESKQLLYKTFDDLGSLRLEVSSRLLGWARPGGRGKPTSGGQHLQEDTQTSPVSAPPQDGLADSTNEVPAGAPALAAAEAYEAKGLMTQAEAAYAKAIVDSDVVSLERYARFLRRTGRFTKSLEINRRVLSQLASAENASETTVERARILTSIGIVERKLGDLRTSRYSLNEAVQTARQGGAEALDVLAYSLDNLGITASRAGDGSQAVDCFRQALSVRQRSGDIAGQARSLTNLARLHKKSGEVGLAKQVCSEAIALLEHIDDQTALASAHAAMGEILELESDLVGAEKSYKTALEINEVLGMPDNIAMSLSQVARILIERGELMAAERYAQRSFEENERTSNREGTVASTHLLGRIFGRTDREALAIGLLEEAAVAYAAIGNPNGEAWARFHLAEVQRKTGHEAEASRSLDKARSLAAVTGNARLRSLTDQSA